MLLAKCILFCQNNNMWTLDTFFYDINIYLRIGSPTPPGVPPKSIDEKEEMNFNPVRIFITKKNQGKAFR